jgi:hypothetical protein
MLNARHLCLNPSLSGLFVFYSFFSSLWLFSFSMSGVMC